MNTENKKKTIVGILIVISLILVISIMVFNNKEETPIEKVGILSTNESVTKNKRPVKKFTKEEEEAFVEQFANKVLSSESSDLLIKELDENIAKLSQEEARQAVDGLMYVIYNNFNTIKLSQDFIDVAKSQMEKGVNINNIEELTEVEDQSFVNFIREMQGMGYYFQQIGDEVTIQIDYKKIKNKYSDYISLDLIDMLDYLYDEGLKSYLTKEGDKLNYDEVAKRILSAESFIEKYPESPYLDFFNESKHFYQQLYFGALDMNYVFDENLVILDETLNHYESILNQHPDSELAKKITEYIDKLKEFDYKKTEDIQVFLLDFTNILYEDIDSEKDGTEKGLSADEINNNIKKVLKELSEKKSNNK